MLVEAFDVPEKMSRVNVPGIAGGAAGPGVAEASAVLVYATFPSVEEAEAIAGELVAMHLAACVNLFPAMRSIYRWQGRVECGEEVAAIVKTRPELADRVVGVVRVAHSYTNPALVVLPAIGGSADFLAWIAAETAPGR